MRVAVLVFPGSNCDHDCYYVLEHSLGISADFVWHKESSLKTYDAVVIPGGFSYGDYLRTGAIAKFSPIMEAVKEFSDEGGKVLGICNGFQILLEAGLLPGAMLRNRDRKFICKDVYVRIENRGIPFTRNCSSGQVLRLPVAHADGNYYLEADELKRLEDKGQIVFRYCRSDGAVSDALNPNGSVGCIAGVCNEKGNILGMMPHPERSSDSNLGNVDGKIIFDSLLSQGTHTSQ